MIPKTTRRSRVGIAQVLQQISKSKLIVKHSSQPVKINDGIVSYTSVSAREGVKPRTINLSNIIQAEVNKSEVLLTYKDTKESSPRTVILIPDETNITA